MKRWKLCDLVPPGTSGELQGLLCLLVMICAFLYSVWKYAAALTHGLETAARSLHRMTDFADLIGAQGDSASFWTPPVFFPLTLVVLAALLLIPCNYYAFWRGAKSIYLMRRLPDRWELARRCLAIPLFTVACALLLVVILLPAFYGIYLHLTPEDALRPGQLDKLWDNFANLFLPFARPERMYY